MDADAWINRLNLKKHPEGGFYSEIYRNRKKIDFVNGSRNLSTSIYFLLKGTDKSHFHQLFSDEIWYFHTGSTVRIHQLFRGQYSFKDLGILDRHDPQVIIKAGTVFGAEVLDETSFCLMSCMVKPGFEFEDFRMVEKAELLKNYASHQDLIERLTLE